MYEPQLVDVPPALADELRRIANAFRQFRAPTHETAPARPRNGDIAYAVGTWAGDLGAEGFYGYEDGAWTKL